MVRVLAFLALVVGLSVAAVWVADRSGTVSLYWQDWRVDSTVPVAAALLLLLAAVLALLYHLYRWLIVSPRKIREMRAEGRRRRGYRALTRGLVAAAAGDSGSAREAAREAEVLLGEPPLTLLLSAQAAQLEGNQAAAGAAFRDMLEHRETEFLGLRGLLVQAVRNGDQATALVLARRAYEINPHAAWVLSNLIEIESAAGNWEGAEQAVAGAVRARRLTRTEGKRKRALFTYQRAQKAVHEDRPKEALALAREALAGQPAFVPAAVLAARLLGGAGRRREARRLVERTWARAPHPELARVCAELVKGNDPLARVRALEALVEARTGAPEGHLALARAALDAGLWGAARSHLEQLLAARPSAEAFRLMALVEEGENGATEAARSWWRKASQAPPDPTWLCARCGTPAPEWTLVCGSCGAVDSLEWRAPPAVPVAAEALAPAALARNGE
jgi:HemY protein